jgi:GNAT superfamily N-acetyltransferase
MNDLPEAVAPSLGPIKARQRDIRCRTRTLEPQAQRLGVGGQLVQEVIAAAQGSFDTLRLRTQNPAAARLYERTGFLRCAGVPDCAHLMELR